MNDLSKYDPESTCPKCGFDKISTRHCGSDAFAEFAVSLGTRIQVGEHMRRTCHRCQHAWAEAPLTQGRGE